MGRIHSPSSPSASSCSDSSRPPVSASESFAIPEYVIPAFAVGALYAGLRHDSQCPQCGTVFSLRRKEGELERDQHPDAPDEILVRRDVSCSQCGYENEEKFWREETESVAGVE